MNLVDRSAPVAPGELLLLHGSDGLQSPSPTVAGLPGPDGKWLTGNLGQIPRNGLHTAVEEWVQQYGPFFKFRLARTTLVAVADGTLITEILRHRPQAFTRGQRLSRIIDETGPVGLFTAEGDQWRRQRKLVMRALTPEAVKGFFPLIRKVTGRLETRWRAAAASGVPCDVATALKCFAVDIAAGLAIGEDVNTLEHPEDPFQADIEFWFALMGRRLVAPFPYWRWFSLGPERRLREAQVRRDRLIARIIAAARERLACDPQRRLHPASIAEALVCARDEPGSEFTDDDVAGNILTMLLAGEDTVANAIAWLLLDLCTRESERQAARSEVDRVLAESKGLASWDDLPDFCHLEALAMESMRRKPIAPVLGVTARLPVDLAGLRIDAGQTIFLATRAASRRSAAFPVFDEFNVNRWAENLEGASREGPDPRREVFPFGAGPRLCPGRYLAMVEMKMVASMALRHFNFEMVGEIGECRERFTFTMGPKSLSLRMRPRQVLADRDPARAPVPG